MFEERKTISLMVSVFVTVVILYIGLGTYYLRIRSLPTDHSGAGTVHEEAAVILRPAQPTQVILPTREPSQTHTPTPVPPSPTPSEAASPAASPTPSREYVVKSGDTLGSIANSYGLTTEELLDANPSLRENPDSLAEGQKLTIPTPGTTATTTVPPSATAEEATTTPPAGPVATDTPAPWATYVVQEGDTLDAIAERFGVTADSIVRFNGLTNPDDISPGQELTIPLR